MAKGLSLSEADQTLLATPLSISHPSELSRATAAEIAPDVTVVRVEWTYNIADAEPPLNETWVDCAACRHPHNHKRGFVVLLSDEQFATVGLVCGKTKHELEYREQLAAFEEKRKRQRVLRQILAAYGHLPELAGAINDCRNDAACRALLEGRRQFPQTFPALWKLLIENPDGVLHEVVAERDYEAERLRDNRYDAKLTELANRRELSRDNPDHEARLVAELAGDPDSKKTPITRAMRRATGQYRGAGFSRVLRIADRMTDIYHRALHALDDVEGKDTAALSTARLDAAVKKFAQVIRDQMSVQEELTAATAFLDPANLTAIGRWISQSRRWRANIGDPTVREGTLQLADASMPIGLPEFHFRQLSHMLAEVTGA